MKLEAGQNVFARQDAVETDDFVFDVSITGQPVNLDTSFFLKHHPNKSTSILQVFLRPNHDIIYAVPRSHDFPLRDPAFLL